jgi:hypothetical protein
MNKIPDVDGHVLNQRPALNILYSWLRKNDIKPTSEVVSNAKFHTTIFFSDFCYFCVAPFTRNLNLRFCSSVEYTVVYN